MDRAKKISSNSNFKVEEVQKVTKDLERAWMDLNNDWTQRKTLLAQRHDFQVVMIMILLIRHGLNVCHVIARIHNTS